MSDLPPWMIAENFGADTGATNPTPTRPQPMGPGFPGGLWIDVTPPGVTAQPQTSTPTPPVQPPPPTISPTPPSSTPAPSLPGDDPFGVGPQSPDDPPAGDLGDLIRLGDAPDELPTLPPGGLWNVIFEDGSSVIGTRPWTWPRDDRGSPRFPRGPDYPWDYDPYRGFHERTADFVDGRPVAQGPETFVGPMLPRILREIIRQLRTRRPPPGDRTQRQRQQQQQRERQQRQQRRIEELYRQRVPDSQPLEVPDPREPMRPPRLPAPQPEPQIVEVPDPYRMPQPTPTAPAPVPVFTPEIAWPPMAPPSRVPTPGTTRVGRPQRARQRIPVAWPLAFGLANLLGRSAREQRLQLFDGIQPGPGTGPGTSPGTFPGTSSPPGISPSLPELAPSLTAVNAPGVQSQQQRCRPCKKPAKKRRNPSSVVATVKPFKRRMSRNSLKNLRGKFS